MTLCAMLDKLYELIKLQCLRNGVETASFHRFWVQNDIARLLTLCRDSITDTSFTIARSNEKICLQATFASVLLRVGCWSFH